MFKEEQVYLLFRTKSVKFRAKAVSAYGEA